jgi:putative SOS response-associated peptidase YedK
MPVILTEDAYAAWLGDSLQPKELSRFLAPLEPGRMECEPPSSSEGPIELDLG